MRKHNENMRRANTLVLAVGILVLLAIIATSYVAATHSTRITASSQQYAAMRGNGVELFADLIAHEIAGALFVRPVDYFNDPQILAGKIADPNFPRLPTPPDAPRYMGDQTDLLDNTTLVAGGDGVPDHLYSTPPYTTVPWTNWSDPSTVPGDPNIWPINEDHPGTFPFGGLNLFPLAGEGNPPGGPGFNDSRWLADTEPMRLAIYPGPDGFMGSADDVVVFTHWRHMTNLARPNNGWRVCRDISNVYIDLDGDAGGVRETPNVVTDLSIPLEQWLSAVPQPGQLAATGDMVFNLNSFLTTWGDWLKLPGEPGLRYADNYRFPVQTPLNFYNLRDLVPDLDTDGQDEILEAGERPLDEFVPDTPRWNVCRVLADADGDGFTDAFWFLAPAGVDRSIRQVVAVRIVDNSSMLNVNLATRFAPSNQNNLLDTLSYRTKGTTPVDLALVGSLGGFTGFPQPLTLPDWPGFFDNPDHWFPAPIIPTPGAPQFNAIYDNDAGDTTDNPEKLWERHLRETGLLFWTSSRPDLGVSNQGEDLFLDELVRHDYWLGAGQSMLASESQHPHTNRNFTPYTIADELELRMFHGNNNPWTYSRLERTTQPSSTDPDNGILHGGAGQNTAGSSEFLGKLGNAELVRDSRRKLTTYSGARNDVMPPWLWPGRTMLSWDFNGNSVNGELETDERRQFEADVRKYDLRRSFYRPDDGFVDEDVDADGVIELPGGAFAAAVDDDVNNDNFVNLLDHHARLQRHLERVFLDVLKRDPLTGNPARIESYFGTGIPADVQQSTRAAASLAANLLAYRDSDPDGSGPLLDEPLPAPDAVIWADPQVPYIAAQKNGYIGLEAQPFLVEAFIAHVYRYFKEAEYDHVTFGDPRILKGDRIVCADSIPGTIVVVQIANPFDVPVRMGPFALRVFGAEMPLSNPGLLAPANLPLLPGRARVYYAMVDDDAVAVSKWIQALQLIATPSVEVFNATNAIGAWKTSRSHYDQSTGNDAVELVRYIDDGTGAPPGAAVVVDRIDIRPGIGAPPIFPTFGEQIADADTNMPPPNGSCIEPVPPPDPADVWPDVFNLCHNNPVPGQPRLCDTHVAYLSWACRPWQIDLDNNGTIDDDERNPRFVFANRLVQELYRVTFNEDDSPDLWFTDEVGAGFVEPPPFNLLDKGADVNDEEDPTISGGTFRETLDFPMQMLQKDGDFEQVGELYNLWIFGHELEYGQGPVPAYQGKTLSTFSEFMWAGLDLPAGADRSRVNRLRITPAGFFNRFLGQPQVNFGHPQYDMLYPLDPAHGTPKLTAGARALEAFVCDGPGALPWPDDVDNDGNSDGIDVELRSLRLAAGFSGRGTPGLINISNATPEVMQSIPGWTRLIHEGATSEPNPYVHAAQAVVRYRDRLGDPTVATDPVTGLPDTLPSYGDRGISHQPPYSWDDLPPGLRQSRGFAAIGELMFLTRSGKWGKDDSTAGAKYDAAQNPGLANILFNSSFRVDYPMVPERDVFQAEMGFVPAGAFLFPALPSGLTAASARVSTDVVHGFDPGPTALPGDDFNVPDDTAADAEEGNLLMAGASNLVTTRSDVFTVYFKVRSFRQNPVTGRWDATDPEMIVDDSRYVMLVDRTEVNRPGDKPRIVYLEKLPQ